MNNIELDIQEKHLNLMKERQIQLSELKSFFIKNNTKRYKEIILLDLSLFEDIFSKSELKQKTENLLSLSFSIGKCLEFNSSFKAILLSCKILEEHKTSIASTKTRNFVYKLFEYNLPISINKNQIIKSTVFPTPKKEFYHNLFKETDKNQVSDFNSYLNFQTDKKQKPNDIKINQFTDQINKLFQGSTVGYFKLYSKISISYDLDYADIVSSSCDIIFMLYNKLSDKNSCQMDLVEYVTQLDDMIFEYFIKPISEDLQMLAEYIMKKEFDFLNKELDKHFI